jgi:hypothetical protein
LACGTEWNKEVHEGFAMLSRELQDFLSRRMKEDMSLMQCAAGLPGARTVLGGICGIPAEGCGGLCARVRQDDEACH